MPNIMLKDVVMRVKDKVDKDNTDLEYYVGGEHIESGEICVTKKGLIQGSTIGPAFHMHFMPGDVLLMSRNPHLRKASVVDFEGICSDVSYICRTKDNDVMLQSYLPFVFQTDHFWKFVEENKRGGLPFFLNWSDFERYEFDLPSIDKQKELSDILWAAQHTKEAYKDLLDKTDELVKSQFIEIFGNYPKERFGDFCSIHARIGWQKLTRAEFLDEGDYYLVTGWDIMPDHTVAFEQCKYVTKERYEQDPKLILSKGDVLLTKDGTLGKVAIIGEMDKPATLNGHIFVIRPKDDRVIPEFLLGLFNSDDFINQLDTNKTGSTIKGITQKALLEFEIPVAPVETQKEYVAFMNQSDKSKFELKKAIENINELIRSLMQQDFSN